MNVLEWVASNGSRPVEGHVVQLARKALGRTA